MALPVGLPPPIALPTSQRRPSSTGKNWNQKEGELLIGPEWLKRWVIVDGEHLLIKENQSSSTIVSSLYLSHLSLSKCWLRPCSLWLIGAQSDPDGRRLSSPDQTQPQSLHNSQSIPRQKKQKNMILACGNDSEFQDWWECFEQKTKGEEVGEEKARERELQKAAEDVLMSGWLCKMGNNAVKDWPKRFCILEKTKFTYWRRQDDANPAGTIPLNTLHINAADHVKPNCLEFVTPKRCYYFYGEDSATVNKWVGALTPACADVRDDQAEEVLSSREENLHAKHVVLRAEKAGYLLKAGKNVLEKWPRRFVVLNNDRVFYYKSSSDDKPLGVVLLVKAKTRPDTKNKKFSLILPTREYHFSAESNEEMKEWCSAIDEARSKAFTTPKTDRSSSTSTSSSPRSEPVVNPLTASAVTSSFEERKPQRTGSAILKRPASPTHVAPPTSGAPDPSPRRILKANPKKSPVSVPKRNSSSNQLSGSQAVPSLASLPSLTPSSVPESPRGKASATGTLRRPKSFRSGKKFQFSARGESDGAVNRLGLSFGLASHMQEEGATEIGSMIGEADQCVNFFEDYMGFSKLISEKFSVCLAAEQALRAAWIDLATQFKMFGERLYSDPSQSFAPPSPKVSSPKPPGSPRPAGSPRPSGSPSENRKQEKEDEPKIEEDFLPNEVRDLPRTTGESMLSLSSVLMSLQSSRDSLTQSQKSIFKHFSEFNKTMEESSVEGSVSQYEHSKVNFIEASTRLKEVSSKTKVKLELVKRAEREKNEKRKICVQEAGNIWQRLSNMIYWENASLVYFSGELLEVLKFNSNSCFTLLVKETNSANQTWLSNAPKLMGNLFGQEFFANQLVKMMKRFGAGKKTPSASKKLSKRTGNDPLLKIVETLVKDERRYIHRLGAIHNFYLPELKKEFGGKMKEMKNIESDVFGGLAGVVEVHVNLLKGLEKGVKSWPFSLASVMSEGLKTEGLKLLEKYSVSLATHQSQLAIIEKKESWKAISKSIQQRNDVEDLFSLLPLPKSRVHRYLRFISEYLEQMNDTGTDFVATTNCFLFLESFQDSLEISLSMAEAEWSEIAASISGYNLGESRNDKHSRYVIKQGHLEAGKSDKIGANFVILLNDAIVYCVKEGDGLRQVGAQLLCDVEFRNVEANSTSFCIVGDDSYWLFSSSSDHSREFDMWRADIERTIDAYEQKYKVSGIPLKTLMRRQDALFATPPFLQLLFNTIMKDAKREGLFRLSGAAFDVKHGIQCLNKNQVFDISNFDIHTVAGIIKQFLRDLPEPLLTWHLSAELLDKFSTAKEGKTDEAKWKEIYESLVKLPLSNQIVLKSLITCLVEVSKHEEVNFMNPHNLAIVFTPNILQTHTSAFDISDIAIVECVIAHGNELFPDLLEKIPFVPKLPSYNQRTRIDTGARRRRLTETDGEKEGEKEGEEEEEEGGGVDQKTDKLGGVVKEGWLMKKGGGNTRSNWKKRWFVLKYGSLAYFKTHGAVEAAGRITLVDCLVGQSASKKANCFAVTVSHRTYLFSASSLEEQADWMKAIQACLETSY